MKLLGIDPGNEQTAYVLWDTVLNTILEKDLVPNDRALEIFARIPADAVCLEMIASYGMSVGKTVFETCLWIGRFVQLFSVRTTPLRLVYRMEVKMHFCYSAKAKDTNIRQALIDLFGKPGTKKEPGLLYGVRKDIWAALAVAVYGAASMKAAQA